MKFRIGLDRFVRWESTTLKILGLVEIIFALTLLIPSLFAFYFGEDTLPFLIPVPFLLGLGSFQYVTSVQSHSFRTVNGLILVVMAWMLIFAICTLPYMLYGLGPIDAVFESVSGVTTTGMSVLGDLDVYPKSLLIWRSMTTWIGGMTVVLIFLYFLPMIGYGRGLFANEVPEHPNSLRRRPRPPNRSYSSTWFLALSTICSWLSAAWIWWRPSASCSRPYPQGA